jgi:8-oxo-dGTP diphosphatase
MPLPRTPALATDCVIFDPLGRVLLVRRKDAPGAGRHALPGGFVKIGETVESACRREVLEEVGIEIDGLILVGVYSAIDRDPRGHIVSVAYTVWLPGGVRPRAGSDAASLDWVDSSSATLTLGPDHARILTDALGKVFPCPSGAR